APAARARARIDLRAHAAREDQGSRRELRARRDELDEADAAAEAAHRPGIHDLPRHHARADAPGTGEHGSESGRRLLPRLLPGAGGSRQPAMEYPQHSEGGRGDHRDLLSRRAGGVRAGDPAARARVLNRAWRMRTLNARTRFIELAGEINAAMPEYWVARAVDRLNEQSKAVRGSRVLVVGVAYKKDVDDIRESPALDVIRLLRRHGAIVDYHDPHVPKLKDDDLELRSVPLTADTLKTTECVIIVTD